MERTATAPLEVRSSEVVVVKVSLVVLACGVSISMSVEAILSDNRWEDTRTGKGTQGTNPKGT